MLHNKLNNDNFTIVEHSSLTSSISSLIIGLFYSSSSFYNIILDQMIIDLRIIYLQEVIKNNIIEPIRKNNLIPVQVFTQIINILVSYDLLDKKYYNQQLEPIILYNIINNVYLEYIQNNQNFTISYLDININNHFGENNLTKLIDEWLNNKLNIKTSDIELRKIPCILPIYLNRKIENKYNESLIDIKYQIKPFTSLDKYSNITFSIHNILCFSQSSNHYYSVLLIDKNWILFDDKSIPCFKIIDMKNKELSNKLKREVIMVFYKYEDIYI